MDRYAIKFGERLRTARQNAGLTQTELAKATRTHQPHVCTWENGKGMPVASSIYKLAKALNVSADYLILGEE